MDDDTNPLAGLDLEAWAAPAPPAGLDDRVIARVAATDEAIAVVHRRRRVKRRWWLAGGLAAALAAVSIALVVIPHHPPDDTGGGSGALVADKPQQLAVGGALANLDPGADVTWQRSGDAIHVAQRAGSATWKVEPDHHLILDVGAAVASIDASNATLRVETRMNPTDSRGIGVTAATAAAMALVTVIVYEGHVKVSGAGQTIVVERGSTVEVAPGHAPHELKNVAGVPVSPVVPPVLPSPPGPAPDEELIPELIVPIGEKITIHDPSGRLRVAVDPRCPGESKLVWPTGDGSRAMEVSEASFSHTCHGIDKHGSIKLVKDPGFGVLMSPVNGAAATETIHVIGAAVPARAQVTIDGNVVETRNKTPWAIDLPYRRLVAVRIDAGLDDIHYYIRRMAEPRDLPYEVSIDAGESVTIHDPSGGVRVRIAQQCPVVAQQMFFKPGQTASTSLHADFHPILAPGAYSYVQRCEREDPGRTYAGTITVVQDDGGAVGAIDPIRAWTVPLSIGGTYTTTGTTVHVADVAASKVDGFAEGFFTAKGIMPATPGVLAVRFDVPGKGAHVVVVRKGQTIGRTGLPASTVERVMHELDPELQGCAPNHERKETIKLAIEADGSVHDITTTLTGAARTCVEMLVAGQRFPKAKGTTRATYTLERTPIKCELDKLVAAGTAAEAVGNHARALAQYDAALRCRFEKHTLQLSFMAACNSGDAKRVQPYWKRMSEDMRAHMIQICLHNHITQDQLDE